jgi:hypothetical protein
MVEEEGGERGRVGRRSVTFDPIADTNEGDKMLDKRLVDLPPSVARAPRRHEKVRVRGRGGGVKHTFFR